MPIEIKELLVEINVSSDTQKTQNVASNTAKTIDEETVKEYIDQMFTILENRKER